ncbi:hypothetical protein FRC01_014530, partial [Tulasnella sp. 417]
MIDRWSESGPISEGGASSNTPASLPPLAPPPKTENIPTPAPAPALIPSMVAAMHSLNLDETKTGIIRVDCPGSDPMYIPSFLTEVDEGKTFTSINDKSKALRVEITQGCIHDPREIKLLVGLLSVSGIPPLRIIRYPPQLMNQNSPDHRNLLGVHQKDQGRLGAGSTEYAFLVTAGWPESSANPGQAAGLRTAIWSLCPFDNSIRALWQDDGSEFLLKSVISSATKRIVFVSDATAFRQQYRHISQFPEV